MAALLLSSCNCSFAKYTKQAFLLSAHGILQLLFQPFGHFMARCQIIANRFFPPFMHPPPILPSRSHCNQFTLIIVLASLTTYSRATNNFVSILSTHRSFDSSAALFSRRPRERLCKVYSNNSYTIFAPLADVSYAELIATPGGTDHCS